MSNVKKNEILLSLLLNKFVINDPPNLDVFEQKHYNGQDKHKDKDKEIFGSDFSSRLKIFETKKKELQEMHEYLSENHVVSILSDYSKSKSTIPSKEDTIKKSSSDTEIHDITITDFFQEVDNKDDNKKKEIDSIDVYIEKDNKSRIDVKPNIYNKEKNELTIKENEFNSLKNNFDITIETKGFSSEKDKTDTQNFGLNFIQEDEYYKRNKEYQSEKQSEKFLTLESFQGENVEDFNNFDKSIIKHKGDLKYTFNPNMKYKTFVKKNGGANQNMVDNLLALVNEKLLSVK